MLSTKFVPGVVRGTLFQGSEVTFKVRVLSEMRRRNPSLNLEEEFTVPGDTTFFLQRKGKVYYGEAIDVQIGDTILKEWSKAGGY